MTQPSYYQTIELGFLQFSELLLFHPWIALLCVFFIQFLEIGAERLK